MFAEGNYCTRHELPNHLLVVWHVTCFRVSDWVTHVIRGAGREFCQRRVVHFFLLTLVLRLTKASAKPLKEDFLYYNIRLKMEREFILRFVPELEDVIQVVWVLVIWPLFLWQVVRNRRTIYDRRWRFMAWIVHTGHFASLSSHFSFSRVYYLSSFISVACFFLLLFRR